MSPAAANDETLDRQFEIAVRRLADDLRFGQDPSPYLGSGIEYVQSRAMVDGDSVRAIDWRVTARTGRLHVKEYEALRTMPAYLVVDTSASMSVSSIPLSKHRLAALLAGGIAIASLRRLSPVGVVAAGDRDLHFRPSLQRTRLYQWLHALERPIAGERTMLAARLDQLSAQLLSRTLVVVISDLHEPPAVAAAKRIAQQHDVIVLHLEDPAERGRVGGGFFHAAEAETGRQFVAHGRSRWLKGYGESVRGALAAAEVDYALLPTDRPFVAPLRQMLAARGGLMRNAR